MRLELPADQNRLPAVYGETSRVLDEVGFYHMTETEYVKHIKTSAQEYLGFIRGVTAGDAARDAVFRWEHIKTHLSAHTAIEVCNAWLAAQEKASA
jgi:hypothetical protein